MLWCQSELPEAKKGQGRGHADPPAPSASATVAPVLFVLWPLNHVLDPLYLFLYLFSIEAGKISGRGLI